MGLFCPSLVSTEKQDDNYDHEVPYKWETGGKWKEVGSARREERRVWSEHCKKRGFLKYVRDKREIGNPLNRLELLYFCPRMKLGPGSGCMILDLSQYNQLLARRKNCPEEDYDVDCCCSCGIWVEDFDVFLPRKEYVERFGYDYHEAAYKKGK